MGTNNLAIIGASIVRAVGTQLDQYFTAITGVFVPRNSAGVPETGTQDLGSTTYKWRDGYISRNFDIKGKLKNADKGDTINIDKIYSSDKFYAYDDNIFGDKSDGASVTISGATTLRGLKQYGDLTINADVTSGFRNLTILVDGTLTINANISVTGFGGAGGAGGVGLSTGNKGGDGLNGGGIGGSGGCKATDTSGGAGGDIQQYSGAIIQGTTHIVNTNSGVTGENNTLINIPYFYIGHGSGGGSGSDGGGANASGAGGAGAGSILIIARNIVVTGARTITSTGVAGSIGTGANGGGGAGGGGGQIAVFYLSETDIASLTLTSTGGAGGAGAGGGRNGGAGGAGLTIKAKIGG